MYEPSENTLKTDSESSFHSLDIDEAMKAIRNKGETQPETEEARKSRLAKAAVKKQMKKNFSNVARDTLRKLNNVGLDNVKGYQDTIL